MILQIWRGYIQPYWCKTSRLTVRLRVIFICALCLVVILWTSGIPFDHVIKHFNITAKKNRSGSNLKVFHDDYFSNASIADSTAIEAIPLQSLDHTKKNYNLTILFWNQLWRNPFFGMGTGNEGFVRYKCRYTNCFTTNKRTIFLNGKSQIDAIVVHGPVFWELEGLAKMVKTHVSNF